MGHNWAEDWREGDKPTRTLKEAGFRDSREESSFKGVRHFWQWSLDMLAVDGV